MAAGPLIAIVDDDREIRDAIGDLLQVEGLLSRSFESAEAFMAVYAPGEFAAVLTDVRMSGMSGLALLKRVRRAEPDLPVIVVTSSANPQTIQEAWRAGARAVLPKPVRNAELMRHLSAILG